MANATLLDTIRSIQAVKNASLVDAGMGALVARTAGVSTATIADVMKVTGQTRPQVRKALNALVTAGTLTKTSKSLRTSPLVGGANQVTTYRLEA